MPFAFADDRPSGLTRASHHDATAETAVGHDPGGLRDRWTGAAATRTREVRDGGRVLLSVDHDPGRGYLLHAPGVGTALIAPGGREVLCAPLGEDWPALLVGQILPLVATVRGLEVFHAAGITVGGRAILLAGAQGAGKTSLAAHLVRAGALLLSDDVVAVDDALRAHPGSCLLRVRAPAHDGERSGGERSGVLAPAADGPAPVAAVYRLERVAAGPAVQALPRPSPLELVRLTFNISVQTPDRLTRQLDLCARLAAGVPIFRIAITSDRDAAAVAAAVRAHLDRPAVAVS